MNAPGSVYLAASGHRPILDVLVKRALAGAKRKGAPRVAVSYAAADAPLVARMMKMMGPSFGGAEVRRFAVEGEHGAQRPAEARAVVDDADLVFVSGGDPVHGARVLVGAGADVWLREARARGTPLVGVSAGSIMLCAWWADWPDEAPEGAPHDGGELVTCTRVVPDLVVDCHAEDDGWSELALVRGLLLDRLGGDADLPRMLGLPTGTGIVVGPDGAIEPIGGDPFRL
jgi:cyanophycinase-like exopeptidase